jgi:hypothetical protein
MMDLSLEDLAKQAHPYNEQHQEKFKAAVNFLRAGRGWVHDGAPGHIVEMREAPRPKRNYTVAVMREIDWCIDT